MKAGFIKGKILIFILAVFTSYLVHAEDVVSITVPPINDPPSAQHIPGKIIWHDLFTNNVKSSRRFYANVLGWRFQYFGAGENGYTLIYNGRQRIGGIVPLKEGHTGNTANQWISYISVPNVSQVSTHVVNNGGKVLLSPRRFERHGELAIFADPEGVPFGVLASSSGDPSDAMPQPGEWAWLDLMAKNPHRQAEFYQGIASYDVRRDKRGLEDNDYLLFSNQVPRAGVVSLPGSKVLPNWLPYVRIKNVEDTITKVTRFGGKVVFEPNTRVFNGRLAIITDPSGAALGVVNMD